MTADNNDTHTLNERYDDGDDDEPTTMTPMY